MHMCVHVYTGVKRAREIQINRKQPGQVNTQKLDSITDMIAQSVYGRESKKYRRISY